MVEEDQGQIQKGVYFAKEVMSRMAQKWDFVCGVSGERGVGKSIGIDYLSMLCKGYKPNQLTNPSDQDLKGIFDFLDKNVLYFPDHAMMEDQVTRLPFYEPVVADEAIKIMFKRRWAASAQIGLAQFFGTCRKHKKVVFCAIPKFKDFDSFFREGIIKVWIHIIKRAEDKTYAVAFLQDWNPFLEDTWHMKENIKIISESTRRKKLVDITLEDKLRALRKTVNYYFDFEIPTLDERIVQYYEDKVDWARVNAPKDTEDAAPDRVQFWRGAASQAIGKCYTGTQAMKQQDIADLCKINVSLVNKMLADMDLRPIDKKISNKFLTRKGVNQHDRQG